jgi:hypothetical protein
MQTEFRKRMLRYRSVLAVEGAMSTSWVRRHSPLRTRADTIKAITSKRLGKHSSKFS